MSDEAVTPVPIRHLNPLGQARWQPALSDGRRYIEYRTDFSYDLRRTWVVRASWRDEPVLYRSRRRAIRVARRKLKSEFREYKNSFKEDTLSDLL